MDVTQNVTQLQTQERNKMVEHVKKKMTEKIQIKKLWQELVQNLTHDRLVVILRNSTGQYVIELSQSGCLCCIFCPHHNLEGDIEILVYVHASLSHTPQKPLNIFCSKFVGLLLTACCWSYCAIILIWHFCRSYWTFILQFYLRWQGTYCYT